MAPKQEESKSSSEDTQPTNSSTNIRSSEDQSNSGEPSRDEKPSQPGSQSQQALSSAQSGKTYGTMSSYGTASSQRPEDDYQDRELPRLVYSPSLRPASDSPAPPLSPQLSARRKPPTMRRGSTKKGLPYRGQEFSVDDDPREYETDLGQESVRATGNSTLKPQSSTLKRRVTTPHSILPRVDSADEEEDNGDELQRPGSKDVQQEDGEADSPPDDAEGFAEDDLSDAESFTLKDRQLAINQTHPFGIRIWKPALYKKNRSVEKGAEEDIHSSPSAQISGWLAIFNVLWTLLFGWWLSILALLGSLLCFLFSLDQSAVEYGKVLASLSWYLLYPFGQFVKLESDENYAEEDEGEGRSISEYERWQNGDLEYGRLFFGPTDRSIIGRRRNSVDSASERDSLLGRTGRTTNQSSENEYTPTKRRLFGRGQWTLGRVVFFASFYLVLGPAMLLVSAICWFMVFWIPMGRVTLVLVSHLRRHPLALTFHSDASYSRTSDAPSSILLCTYRAAGVKYWKYTVDGTNIFLINLLGVVLFTIIDYFVLDVALSLDSWVTNPALIFPLALFSIIPLAYFIGQAVASISAQSSMGLGAVVNAFFSTVVEVFLYCVALNDGKGQLVEGSIIGSIFAGILLLPGVSMCFGALKRKTQRFNVRSAGVTSTMLLFAVVAAFGPTLFYQVYGSHELKCKSCIHEESLEDRDCRRCFFSQTPALSDRFFIEAVRPYCWASALMLFLSYIIGLWFTLRTHAAMIWSTENDDVKPTLPPTADITPAEFRHGSIANGVPSQPTGSTSISKSAIRDSQLYKRILGQSLQQVGLSPPGPDGVWDRDHMPVASEQPTDTEDFGPHVVPPKTDATDSSIPTPKPANILPGLSEEENQNLVLQVAEMAATAATVAARDAVRNPRRTSHQSAQKQQGHPPISRQHTMTEEPLDMRQVVVEPAAAVPATGGGHDAPNWSKTKSTVILLIATVAYAIIAEILVDTVDVVLVNADIDQKFLGLTLFALVPNTTEFLNAISFAMNGNIALSMEIGSAYALQVCLLQIPALVLFSAVRAPNIAPEFLTTHTFNLIFPQWDMILVILSVLLLSNLLGEGKSNYFKGSILVLTYLVAMLGFWFSGYNSLTFLEIDRFDTLASQEAAKFWTAGRSSGGRAYPAV